MNHEYGISDYEYMMGCPNAAWLVSCIKRVDPRNNGTKNLGTTKYFRDLRAFLCIICVITNYLIIASTLTVLYFPVWVGISMKSLSAAAVVMIASLVFLHKHRLNFRRLREGTEIPIWKQGRTG